MASRWYLRDSSNAAAYGKTGPTGKQSSHADEAPESPANKSTCRAATVERGAAEVSKGYTLTGSHFGETMIGMFASPPLGPQTIADGTALTLAMAIRQDTAGMNLYLAAFFYVWRQGVGKVRDLGADLSVDDVEAVITQRWRRIVAISSGDFELNNGDQLVCEVWGDHGFNFGTRTATFFLGGAADDYATEGEANDVSDSASWFECSQTLAEATHPYYYPGLDRQRGLKG